MAEQPPAVAPVVVPRWVQLVLLPLALVGLWGVLRAAGPVVLIFTIAGLIALLLNPFVTVLRRAGLPRGPSVAATCVSVLLVLGGLGVVLANPVADQVSAFRDSVPEIVDDADAALVDLQGWLDRNEVDLHVKIGRASCRERV